MLHGDAGPVVEGVGEAIVAGLAAYDDATLSGSLGHWRDPCQTSQGGIISPLQRLPGFGEQRGEDGPSHSRQGCEDRRVMLLFLPRLALLLAARLSMSAAILRSVSLIWRLTSFRRGMIEATWALAASTVPGASLGGGLARLSGSWRRRNDECAAV